MGVRKAGLRDGDGSRSTWACGLRTRRWLDDSMQAAINRAALLHCGVLAAVLQTAAKRCKPLQSVANRCKVLQSVAKLHSQVVSLGLLAEVYRRKGESAKAISFYKRACMVPLCGTYRAAVGYRAALHGHRQIRVRTRKHTRTGFTPQEARADGRWPN